MRYFLVAAILAAGSAFAEGQGLADPQAKELAEAVQKRCQNGCMILSPEQAEALEERINAAIERARAEGFAAGMADAKERCRSLI